MNWEPSEQFDGWEGCLGCAHWRGGHCVAYPKRIPLPLISGEVDHMVPRPGQVGDAVFEPMDVEHWRATGERRPRREAPDAAGVGVAADGAPS